MSTVVPFPQRPTPAADTIGGPTRLAPVVSAVYTVAETAKILRLSLGTTYALVRSGEIPARKAGGRWIISKRQLHDWIDGLPTASVEDVAAELDRLERQEQRQRRRNGA